MEEVREALEFAAKWTLICMPFVFSYVIISYFKSFGAPKDKRKKGDEDKNIDGK